MKQKRTLTTYSAKGKWTKWIPLEVKKYNSWSWMCCNCELVHDVQIRLKDNKIQFRMARNKFLTKYWKKRGIKKGR